MRGRLGVVSVFLGLFAASTVPAAAAGTPRLQAGVAATVGVVLGKKPTWSAGLEATATGLFRFGIGDRGPYGSLVAKMRWVPDRKQLMVGPVIRVGGSWTDTDPPFVPPVRSEGCQPMRPTWTPVHATSVDLGFMVRRRGGPTVSLGATATASQRNSSLFLGGSATADTALRPKRAEAVEGSWTGAVDAVHIEGAAGGWVAPDRVDFFCF